MFIHYRPNLSLPHQKWPSVGREEEPTLTLHPLRLLLQHWTCSEKGLTSLVSWRISSGTLCTLGSSVCIVHCNIFKAGATHGRLCDLLKPVEEKGVAKDGFCHVLLAPTLACEVHYRRRGSQCLPTRQVPSRVQRFAADPSRGDWSKVIFMLRLRGGKVYNIYTTFHNPFSLKQNVSPGENQEGKGDHCGIRDPSERWAGCFSADWWMLVCVCVCVCVCVYVCPCHS